MEEKELAVKMRITEDEKYRLEEEYRIQDVYISNVKLEIEECMEKAGEAKRIKDGKKLSEIKKEISKLKSYMKGYEINKNEIEKEIGKRTYRIAIPEKEMLTLAKWDKERIELGYKYINWAFEIDEMIFMKKADIEKRYIYESIEEILNSHLIGGKYGNSVKEIYNMFKKAIKKVKGKMMTYKKMKKLDEKMQNKWSFAKVELEQGEIRFVDSCKFGDKTVFRGLTNTKEVRRHLNITQSQIEAMWMEAVKKEVEVEKAEKRNLLKMIQDSKTDVMQKHIDKNVEKFCRKGNEVLFDEYHPNFKINICLRRIQDIMRDKEISRAVANFASNNMQGLLPNYMMVEIQNR